MCVLHASTCASLLRLTQLVGGRCERTHYFLCNFLDFMEEKSNYCKVMLSLRELTNNLGNCQTNSHDRPSWKRTLNLAVDLRLQIANGHFYWGN